VTNAEFLDDLERRAMAMKNAKHWGVTWTPKERRRFEALICRTVYSTNKDILSDSTHAPYLLSLIYTYRKELTAAVALKLSQ
jgi:hypothetical protein